MPTLDYIRNPKPVDKRPKSYDFYIPQEEKIKHLNEESDKMKQEAETLKNALETVKKEAKKKRGKKKVVCKKEEALKDIRSSEEV